MTDPKIVSLILIVVVPIILFILFVIPNQKENFSQMYRQKPYGYVKTGTKPLNYYVHNRYRKPYRYPFQIVKEQPIKHLSYLD